MEIVLALVILVVLAAFVTAPLRRRADAAWTRRARPRASPTSRRARRRKYREIRDAELDREQGKLSDADWTRLDAELRREAIEVLKRIDALAAGPSVVIYTARRWKASSTSFRCSSRSS